MYKRFAELCADQQITPTFVAKQTGIAQQTLSAWKKGEYTPKVDKLMKLANYFGVSVEEFIKEAQ